MASSQNNSKTDFSSNISNIDNSQGVLSVHETDAKWYPLQSINSSVSPRLRMSSIDPETVYNILREQRMDYESKFIGMKNELISVRNEFLLLKEEYLKLRDECGKIRLNDERQRNLLLRRHISFPFIPEYTSIDSARENDSTY